MKTIFIEHQPDDTFKIITPGTVMTVSREQLAAVAPGLISLAQTMQWSIEYREAEQ